jgi:hypothetical protein
LDRRLGGTQSRYGRYGEEKNLGPAGNRTAAVKLVAIPGAFIIYTFINQQADSPVCVTQRNIKILIVYGILIANTDVGNGGAESGEVEGNEPARR